MPAIYFEKRKMAKVIRMLRNYILSKFRAHLPLFLHIAPIKRCNTACSYCYQFNNKTTDMSFGQFESIIDTYYGNGLSIVSFTGGEPTLWQELDKALELCDKKRIFTQLTSNGVDLSFSQIDSMRKNGLDYLAISIDSFDNAEISKKTFVNNFHLLKYAKSIGLIVSSNFVLNKSNFNDLELILKKLTRAKIPLSIGIIVPPLNKDDSWAGDKFCFSHHELENVSKYILSIYDEYLILEPRKYFENLTTQDKRKVWNCSIASRRSIHINPAGKIYWCLKLNRLSPFVQSDLLNKKTIDLYRMQLNKINSNDNNGCNKDCYSNCAYASYYYDRHPIEFFCKLRYIF